MLSLWIPVNTVFVFALLPTITNYTLGMLNCIEVNGVSYLQREMTMECYSSEHVKQLLFFVLPFSVFWILGFPTAIYFVLRRNKANLDNKKTITNFGLFYIGFKDEYFYWQIVFVNGKRILYTILTILLMEHNQMMFILSIFTVMYVYT